MEVVAVKAAGWVVGKALGSVTGTLLEAWAFSTGLGPKVDALKVELLCAQAMLEYNTQGREILNPVLKELLLRLQQLAYGADNVLDEIEYFRIQDELDGTYDAADAHAGGCVRDIILNTRHVAGAVAAKLKPSCGSRHTIHGEHGCLSSVFCSCGGGIGNGRDFLSCASLPFKEKTCLCAVKPFLCGAGAWKDGGRQRKYTEKAPKQKFNRVGISAKMEDITEHLKYVCAKVYSIVNLEFMGTTRMTRITTQDLANNNRFSTIITTLNTNIETRLYGRDIQMRNVVDRIIHGNYFDNNDKLVVFAIVGPGGIGKTTFTQHVCAELKSHFEVMVWICVSHNFTTCRLAREAVKQITSVIGEKENCSNQELIEQRLKSKRFLLVLDDMWSCPEDEWNTLLAPFRRAGGKGSVVIVTTRIPEVANLVKNPVDCAIEMGRLEDKDFMDFFEDCVFGSLRGWEDHTELRDVGEQIVRKLEGFPLAAKIVGRLLKKQLTLEHWNRVLESKLTMEIPNQ